VEKFEKSIFIKRSAQEVFDFISDEENDSKWQNGVVSSELTTDGPKGVGSTTKVVRNFMGRKIEATVEVIDWTPPNQATFKSTSGPIPMQFTSFLEEQDGGTMLTMKGQAEFGGFMKLASGMAVKQVEKNLSSDLATLKKVLETA